MYDAGKTVPAIENRPSLTGWGWLWDAFWELNTCRSIGMAAGPIPWTAVQRYAEVEELHREEAYLLHQVIRYLDDKLLAHQREQVKAASSAKTVKRSPLRGARR